VNKTIKMSEKAAQLDAILRTGALSDCFTQDLDSEAETEVKADAMPAPPPNPVLRQEIAKALATLGFQGTTKAQYEAEVLRRTDLPLHPANYPAILAQLRAALEGQAA